MMPVRAGTWGADMGLVCISVLGVVAAVVAGLFLLATGVALGAVAAIRALRRGRGGPA